MEALGGPEAVMKLGREALQRATTAGVPNW